jgi:hypothetical protein
VPVPRRLGAFAVLSVLVLAPAGCGAPTVSSGDVAKAAADVLEKQVGTRPTVQCPHDLEAKVGAHTTCRLTTPGLDGTYGVTVTVKSVQGDTAHFDVQVENHPQG